MVTAVGLNVSALALTVALPGAPTGGGGVAGASVGGTAVGGMGVAVLCGAVGAVVATPVALAVAVATVAAAVALSGAVVAGGFAAEDVPRAVEVAEAKIGVAHAASEGTISGADMLVRPLLKPAELVEAVPGGTAEVAAARSSLPDHPLPLGLKPIHYKGLIAALKCCAAQKLGSIDFF